MLKHNDHTPAHLLLDDTVYFITAAIYEKRPLIRDSELKQKLIFLIRKYLAAYDWELHQWVILDNHYHIMAKSRKGEVLSAIIRNIHRTSACLILDATRCEKPVWWNYWDYCPRDEKDYMTRLNYLLFNPVKHGYTRDLKDYPFSGFAEFYAETGREQLIQQFRQYPDYKSLVLYEAEKDDF